MRLAALTEPVDAELGGSLIEAAGTAAFGTRLLSAAQQFDFVEEVFACRFSPEGKPDIVASSSGVAQSDERAEFYARRFYRHDPARMLWSGAAAGTGFARQIRASQIVPYDYRAICFDRPSFVDKLCFGWRGREQSVVLSFYRRRPGEERGTAKLAALAGIALSAIARTKADASGTAEATDLTAKLEGRLERSFPQLHGRELQVCARTLAGHEADRIASELGIGRASVLTYRQRAYQRYGFSRASDFLPAILD